MRYTITPLLLLISSCCNRAPEPVQSDGPPVIEIEQFMDHADRYRGRTVVIGPVLPVLQINDHDRLPAHRGTTMAFQGMSSRFRAELPDDLQVPNAGALDTVLVTLRVDHGAIDHGNVVVSVERAGR